MDIESKVKLNSDQSVGTITQMLYGKNDNHLYYVVFPNQSGWFNSSEITLCD